MTDNEGKKDFSILYKKYVKSLRNHLIYKYNIPEDFVEDLLEEIFFKFFKDIESFRDDSGISTCLNQIATSVANDYWRKNAK